MSNAWTISCRSCGRHWKFAGTRSDYERMELESRPCPHCFAVALSVPETPAAAKVAGPRRFGSMKIATRSQVEVA